jgi:type IV pilus assembly protein PilQ
VLALLFPASMAAAQAPNLDARVNLRLADKTLEDVVARLREVSGANIVVIDPAEDTGRAKISDARITLDLTDVAWRDALEIVAEKVHGTVEERSGGVLAVTSPTPIFIQIENADIRQVIDLIAKQAGANVVIGKEVVGTVSVRFNGVPWQDALDVTVKTLGYTTVSEKHGVIRVVSPEKLQDQLETRTYQLRFLRPKSLYKPQIKSEFIQTATGQANKGGAAGETTQDYLKKFSVLSALSKALSNGGKIEYIDTQNVVIITDTAQVHEAIKTMLARLDVEPMQVFCDVKFVSTTNGDVLNLGVDYGDNGPQATLTGGQIPITVPFTLGRAGWEDLIIASPNGYGPYADPSQNGGNTVFPDTIFGSLSFTQMQATLRLLQRDTKAEVIQAPKIIALDGNEATIFVGETIRYAEAKSEQGQAGGLQLSVAEASGSPVEVGFQLLIRPNIIPGTQKIQMEVIPKETSLSGTGNSTLAPPGFDVFTVGASGLAGSIALPRTRSSTIVTTMMLETGQTAVIGGLSTDSDTEIKTAVPFLSKIPILGELFKHQSKDRDRRSLMVFITPTIVHSSEDTELQLQQELRRRRANLKDELETLLSADFESNGAPSTATISVHSGARCVRARWNSTRMTPSICAIERLGALRASLAGGVVMVALFLDFGFGPDAS